MTSRRSLVVALAVAAAVLLAGRAVATLYVDYRWYAAMGAAELWRAQIANAFLLRAASALVGGAFVFANLWAVRHSVVSLVLPRRVGNIEIGEEVPGRYLMLSVALASVLFALLFFGTIPRDAWTALAAVRYGQAFGESEPYFLLDLGFYVYWLPLETALYYWAIIALALVTALVVFLYALTPSLRWERGALRVSAYVRRHLGILGALLILLLAWSYRLDAYETLLYGSGAEGAFTYADHKVIIPANLVLVMMSVIAAVVVGWSSWMGQLRLTFVAVTGVLLLSLVLRQALPVVAQRLAPHADPAARERSYLGTRAGYTRRAYGLETVQLADSSIAFGGLGDAAPSVPVWDPAAAARAIDRTRRSGQIVGELAWERSPVGVLLAAVVRPSEDSAAADGWSIDRVLATGTDDRGGIVRVDADGGMPDDDRPTPRALVYEDARGYAIVADSTGRLPAPHVDGWRSRLAHAWSAQNFRLLVSDLPHPRPAVVLRRDVRERVRALAPFFMQGSDVATVIRGDSVLWVIDLYSASASYPLSRPVQLGDEMLRYVRHAATAIVNATTGRVTIATDSLLDPVAQTWTSRFPSLFVPRSALPSDLAASLPPPVDGAVAQAIAFARYGPRAPFESADAPQGAWPTLHVPRTDDVDSLLAGGGPVLQLLPDGRWAWPLPITDEATRVRGLVVAAGGARPAMYWLPLPTATARWTTVRERLLRGPEGAAREPRTLAGAVRVVAVGRDAAFAQPFFVWRNDGAPTVSRVAVLVGDSVRAARTLAAAAGVSNRLPAAALAPATPAEFRARVERLYDAMRSALRDGDWTRFGAAYDSLGRLLGRAPQP